MADNTIKFIAGATIIGGVCVGLYYWVIRPGQEREQEIIALLNDAEAETAEFCAYSLRAVTEGIPEEVYGPVCEAYQAAMTAKLDHARDLVVTETFIDRVVQTAWEFGIDIVKFAFLAVAVIGSFYATGWLIKEIHKRIRRPPNFPCGKCGAVFVSEAELEAHVRATHPVTTDIASIRAAQFAFQRLPYWVQSAVASEAAVYDTVYEPWESLSPALILAIALACIVLMAWLITTAPALVPSLALI